MKILHKIINQSNSEAEIYLYGIIGRFMDIDLHNLVRDLESLRKEGVKKVIFYVNCEGGDLMMGEAFWSYLDRTDIEIVFVVDGVAASMMALLITNTKHYVKGSKYSKYMYHRVQGGAYGNSEDLRNYADMMDKFEPDLIDMVSKRTKLDPKKVKKDFFGEKEKWLTAQEALDLGLIDEIIDGRAEIIAPQNLKTSHDVYQYFENQLTNCITNKQNMKKLATLLNLSDEATEQAVETAVQNLINTNIKSVGEIAKQKQRIDELQNQIAESNKAKVKNLIDTAVTAKKFGEDMRETYTAMATENYDRTEKVISNMTGVTPVINLLDKDPVPSAQKDWTYDDYFKANKLENLKATNLNRFKELYKGKFNRDFVE